MGTLNCLFGFGCLVVLVGFGFGFVGFLVFLFAWPCRGWISQTAVAKSQLRHLAGVIQGYYVCKRGLPLAVSMFVMCYVCTVCMCWVFFFFSLQHVGVCPTSVCHTSVCHVLWFVHRVLVCVQIFLCELLVCVWMVCGFGSSSRSVGRVLSVWLCCCIMFLDRAAGFCVLAATV